METLGESPFNVAACSMTQFFASERLIARSFTPLDLDAFVAMRADPEVARFQDWTGFTRGDGLAFLEENAERRAGQPGWFQIALERKQDRRFVGDCGLRTADPGIRLAQIGYTIARPYWTQGYATEAVRGLIGYVFGHLAIDCIGASVDPLHNASIRVLEKAGFIEETDARLSPWLTGGWAGDATYTMTRRSFEFMMGRE
jgi:RimJ/RimL family protein N-acetyltransferase